MTQVFSSNNIEHIRSALFIHNIESIPDNINAAYIFQALHGNERNLSLYDKITEKMKEVTDYGEDERNIGNIYPLILGMFPNNEKTFEVFEKLIDIKLKLEFYHWDAFKLLPFQKRNFEEFTKLLELKPQSGAVNILGMLPEEDRGINHFVPTQIHDTLEIGQNLEDHQEL